FLKRIKPQIEDRISNKAVDNDPCGNCRVFYLVVQLGDPATRIGIYTAQFYVLMIDFVALPLFPFYIVNPFYDENITEVFGIGKMKIESPFCCGNAQIKFQVQIGINLTRSQLEFHLRQILFWIIAGISQTYLDVLGRGNVTT